MTKLDEIKNGFEDLRDEKKAKKMSAYMRGKFPYYGIPAPLRKSSYRHLIHEEKKAKTIDWDLLDVCWDKEYREFQYFVIDYLVAMQEFLSYEDLTRVESYARTKQWWDSIDGLDRIFGNIGLKDSRVNQMMLEWSTDKDFWVRRIAIDHQLCRNHKTDTELLEKIIVNNFGSKEFFINKAIGWSLRDYSKTNPRWVHEFIERHKAKMSPLSIREAGKYL